MIISLFNKFIYQSIYYLDTDKLYIISDVGSEKKKKKKKKKIKEEVDSD